MVRDRPALILKVLAVLAPLLLIYWQDLEVVASDALNSEVMNYIIIPFFIAYALYRKRRMLQAVMPPDSSISPYSRGKYE